MAETAQTSPSYESPHAVVMATARTAVAAETSTDLESNEVVQNVTRLRRPEPSVREYVGANAVGANIYLVYAGAGSSAVYLTSVGKNQETMSSVAHLPRSSTYRHPKASPRRK